MTTGTAITVMASVTWKRLRRGRTLWIGCTIGLLPILFVVAGRHQAGVLGDAFGFEIIVVSVVAALLVGATIGDEIEARTHTYLWSRPLPRWTILAGKLLVVVPAVVVIAAASWLIVLELSGDSAPPMRGQSYLALALGAITISLLATAITTLTPKHGMALTICYLLFFDTPAGLMPVSIRYAAITEQLRLASGVGRAEGSAASGIIGLAIIGVICGLLAAWRARKLEA